MLRKGKQLLLHMWHLYWYSLLQINHEWGEDGVIVYDKQKISVITCDTDIRNDYPNHGGDQNMFEVMISTEPICSRERNGPFIINVIRRVDGFPLLETWVINTAIHISVIVEVSLPGWGNLSTRNKVLICGYLLTHVMVQLQRWEALIGNVDQTTE